MCNVNLKSCLSSLPDKMSEWEKPPRAGTEQDTASFMQQAEGWFSTDAQNATTTRQPDGNYRLPVPPEFQKYMRK